MFKKLHSNRDPQDTVYAELKKEFALYYWKANSIFEQLVLRYPKFCYWLMVFLLLVSFTLSFTIFRNHEPVAKVKMIPQNTLSTVGNGFDKIMETSAALKETIALKNQADSLLAKKNLSNADSTTLEKDLDRLQQLNNHLTH
jgi:hypothetical protein